MAYTTGVASSVDDFISQLVTFAVANAGFANAGSVTSSSGSGSRTIYRISKGGIYWNFVRYTDNKGIFGAMGYSGLSAGYAVPNSTVALGVAGVQQYFTEMNTWDFTGPFVGHYFFTDGTCVHAVIEVASGIFNHISFGSVTKLGAWVGGEYLTAGWYGTRSNVGGQLLYNDAIGNGANQSRVFNDDQTNGAGNRLSTVRWGNTGATGNFVTLAGATISYSSSTHGMFCGASWSSYNSPGSIYGPVLRDAHNETTERSPIYPGVLRLRDSVSTLKHMAGSIPYVGFMKMSPDMSPKDIINTDWQIFPVTMRTGGSTLVAAPSYEYALAYRRI